ncbi:MerR family transcriptional regulator [Herpetosiphon geysericola]|nr:MerR family transcriptional regulator [Herpetosiphon geysericola]
MHSKRLPVLISATNEVLRMFTVGEFARIAQVSKRFLRYYDELGLFPPATIDHSNGRRYYSAEQLPALNRILVLKDLGFSLEQIRDLSHDQISADQMQRLLRQKKAEIEAHLREEMQRIQRIESRLNALNDFDKPLNVVLKPMPSQSVLSTRIIAENFESGLQAIQQIRQHLPTSKRYGMCFCICQTHNDSLFDMDLEIGCFIEQTSHAPVKISQQLQLRFDQHPASELMAASVVQGPIEKILTSYEQIGRWAELNGYRPTALPREISLRLPENSDGSDLLTEVQFPIEPIQK